MNDGGPAFPCPMDGDWPEPDRGLSLLDYMAGKVLEGLYAGGRWIDDPYKFAKFSVEEAYAVAGLAIKERAKLYAAAKEATNAKAD